MLDAWEQGTRGLRPTLVVIALSGGAYRAAYWSALVLDELHRRYPELTRHVRLVTGASGGMVTGGYLTARACGVLPEERTSRSTTARGDTLRSLINHDICEARCPGTDYGAAAARLPTRYPLPWDSLSPVAEQMATRDPFFGLSCTNRGEILETQWPSLEIPFSALRAAEARGCPSIILSPTLVDTGNPLLITNLSLGESSTVIRGEARELFRLFPAAT